MRLVEVDLQSVACGNLSRLFIGFLLCVFSNNGWMFLIQQLFINLEYLDLERLKTVCI